MLGWSGFTREYQDPPKGALFVPVRANLTQRGDPNESNQPVGSGVVTAPIRLEIEVGRPPPMPNLVSIQPFDPTEWLARSSAEVGRSAELDGLMQQLTSQRFLPPREAQDEVVVLAAELEDEGVLSWSSEYHAIILLEVERVRAYRDWDVRLARGEAARLDFSTMLERAMESAQSKDGFLADVAWLYVLEALGLAAANTHDPELLTETAFAVLERRPGAFVARQAALRLGASRVEDVSPYDLDRLQEVYDRYLSSEASFAVSSFALRASQRLGDNVRLSAWLERYRDSVVTECGDPESAGSDWCQSASSHLWSLEAYLAHREVGSPTDWRSVLGMLVHECAADFEPVPSVGQGRWTGERWVWINWDPASGFTGCIAAAEPLRPWPEHPVMVRLDVVVPPHAGEEPR